MANQFEILREPKDGQMSNLAVSALSYALDGLNLAQNVTANNVANQDTPGFTASTVNFQSSLQQALSSNANSATAVASVGTSTAAPGSNGNNVSLATELTNLENSALSFSADSTLLTDQFKLISGSMGGAF